MKPIEQLVKLGIVNAANGSRGVVYSLDEFPCHPMAVMSEDQVLSNNDVMAAVMVMLRKRGFSWLLASMPDGQAMVTVTSPMPDRTEWDAQIVDDNDITAIILAGLQALEGE